MGAGGFRPGRPAWRAHGQGGREGLEAQRLSAEAARADDLAQIDRARSARCRGARPAYALGWHQGRRLQPAAVGCDSAAGGQAELLATIEESTDTLSELVDNLLGLSRLQAGALSVHLDAVPLDAVVGSALLHLHQDRQRSTSRYQMIFLWSAPMPACWSGLW